MHQLCALSLLNVIKTNTLLVMFALKEYPQESVRPYELDEIVQQQQQQQHVELFVKSSGSSSSDDNELRRKNDNRRCTEARPICKCLQ